MFPLRDDGKVNHHDRVLLHDADEHDEADETVNVQLGLGKKRPKKPPTPWAPPSRLNVFVFQLKMISVSSAPKPAEGRPDKIVTGWMKLS